MPPACITFSFLLISVDFRVLQDMKVDQDRKDRTQQIHCAIKLEEDGVES